jgi:hypothetical protein
MEKKLYESLIDDILKLRMYEYNTRLMEEMRSLTMELERMGLYLRYGGIISIIYRKIEGDIMQSRYIIRKGDTLEKIEKALISIEITKEMMDTYEYFNREPLEASEICRIRGLKPLIEEILRGEVFKKYIMFIDRVANIKKFM